jgi:hypothetical protein
VRHLVGERQVAVGVIGAGPFLGRHTPNARSRRRCAYPAALIARSSLGTTSAVA